MVFIYSVVLFRSYDPVSLDPDCISLVNLNNNLESILQGMLSNILLEGEVRMISNDECETWLVSNSTLNRAWATTRQLTLEHGVNEQVGCTIGVFNEKTKSYSVIGSDIGEW